MIIHLKKYREHGYIKALGYIWVKMFVNRRMKQQKLFPMASQNLQLLNYPELLLNDKQKLKCTSCQLCEHVCPTSCLSITPDRPVTSILTGSAPKKFHIKLNHCIQCGLCKDACPVDAIDMTGEYQTEDFKSEFDLTKVLQKTSSN